MKLKVLLFYPWIKSKGGGEKVLLELLKRSRHKIHVITWFYNREKTFQEFEKFEDRIISIFPDFIDSITRTFLFRGPFFGLFGNIIKILKEEYSLDYNIIQINTAGIGELILLRTNIYKEVPVVTYVFTPLRATYKWDIIFNFKYRFRKLWFMTYYYKLGIHIYNYLEKWAWNRVDFAMFVSELSRRRALEKGLIDISKTKVIYPGVDIDIEPGNYEDYFLYVARFGMAKRQDVALLAWKMFVKRYPEYKLILAGGLENKKYYKILQMMVRKLNIKNVILLPSLPYSKVKELHSNALAEIHVPFMEDFGIAPLEAIAAAKPLIAVDSMGVFEILPNLSSIIKIREHIDRVIVARRLFKAMEEFIKNKDYYIEEAIKNREIIEKLNLTWEKFVKEVDETLEKIANEKA